MKDQNKSSQNSINQALTQMKDLLQQIQNSPPLNVQKFPKELFESLATLTQLVRDYNELCQFGLQEAGLTREELAKIVEESPETTAKDKQIIKDAQSIAGDARTMQLALSKAMKQKKKKPKGSQSKEKQQTVKERRKLFKNIGSDKNWIPL